ncbi:prepilin peptidase [Salibacterium halotolerans]|uniref:Type IV leader peptidase family protein n=1 Tax=Salibacterium halotolerans TaxID=1884432 RepID=A0A1I5TTH9_9BACI|nr:prepilin peptidase [Salibacterium halotolerans]SFP85636.1 Type IV leader peptidase family protein [Salibacterium halotolerans]
MTVLIVTAVLLLYAAYKDIKQNRIPNYFIVIILLSGILHLLINTPVEWWLYVVSMTATLIVFFLLWISGFLGAGDAKLAAAAALTLSFPDTYWFWIFTIGGGVLLSATQILRYDGIRGIIDIFWRWGMSIIYKTDKREKDDTFPFAPIIFLAWVVVIW